MRRGARVGIRIVCRRVVVHVLPKYVNTRERQVQFLVHTGRGNEDMCRGRARYQAGSTAWGFKLLANKK